MLKANRTQKLKAGSGRFIIIASKYNARYVDAMVKSAQAVFKRAGAVDVKTIRVPGAFEIPTVAARLANNNITGNSSLGGEIAGIICLGVILRGQTVHAEHIGRAVTDALMSIQLRYEIPVIHEVLLLENEEQARVRCMWQEFNRGTEAAQTALEMARVMKGL